MLIEKAHGDQGIKETSYDYYDKTTPFYNSLKYVFILNSIYNIPFNCIFTSESFEDLPSLSRFFKNPNGSLKRTSILIFRFMFLVVSFALTYLSSDLAIIFDLGGGLFSPFMSYIFPIIWARVYEKKRRIGHRRSLLWNIMDYLTLLFGIAVGIFANYYGFWEYFSSKAKAGDK